jgi:formamidopyrimidine-DNA glycosylase
MLPPGLDLSHPPGCFQPLVVPLARLARADEIRRMRLIPVDDVADDVMHQPASVYSSRPDRCGTQIRVADQGRDATERVTYWCPRCQT